MWILYARDLFTGKKFRGNFEYVFFRKNLMCGNINVAGYNNVREVKRVSVILIFRLYKNVLGLMQKKIQK